jgi:hypothetical protein
LVFVLALAYSLGSSLSLVGDAATPALAKFEATGLRSEVCRSPAARVARLRIDAHTTIVGLGIGPVLLRPLKIGFADKANKVLLWPRRSVEAAWSLRGTRCSDGASLRLWFRATKLPADWRVTVRDTVGRLEPIPANGHWTWGGHLLPETPGLYELSVWRGARRLGAGLVTVRPS